MGRVILATLAYVAIVLAFVGLSVLIGNVLVGALLGIAAWAVGTPVSNRISCGRWTYSP